MFLVDYVLSHWGCRAAWQNFRLSSNAGVARPYHGLHESFSYKYEHRHSWPIRFDKEDDWHSETLYLGNGSSLGLMSVSVPRWFPMSSYTSMLLADTDRPPLCVDDLSIDATVLTSVLFVDLCERTFGCLIKVVFFLNSALSGTPCFSSGF